MPDGEHYRVGAALNAADSAAWDNGCMAGAATPSPPAETADQRSLAGPGGADLRTVSADLAAVTAAAGNQDVSAMANVPLTADAKTASTLPPPSDPADYGVAMKDLELAGCTTQRRTWPLPSGTSQLRSARSARVTARLRPGRRQAESHSIRSRRVRAGGICPVPLPAMTRRARP